MASTGSSLAASVAGTIPDTTPIMEEIPNPRTIFLNDNTNSNDPNWIKVKP
jgi:hypothetical protein